MQSVLEAADSALTFQTPAHSDVDLLDLLPLGVDGAAFAVVAAEPDAEPVVALEG